VGYASRSYFSHAFKAAYGCDPSAYRSRATNLARSLEPLTDRGAGVTGLDTEVP
ncbi:MAG: helix-turn-helix transcriptional regulator, partial [Parafilimonas terrae]|nr:helix-turn-helix transcriptional regulator [Parafilimonas terrae]